MIANSMTLDWKEIFEETWDLLIPSLLKVYESVKIPIWDNFLKDWVISNVIWLAVITVLFVIGWPVTSNKRVKLRKWYFSIWGFISSVLIVLIEVYHVL